MNARTRQSKTSKKEEPNLDEENLLDTKSQDLKENIKDIENKKEIERKIDIDINSELESQLLEYSADMLIDPLKDRRIKPEQINKIIEDLSNIFQVNKAVVANALGELFRKGGANAGTPDSQNVTIYNNITHTATELRKYDVKMAMQKIVGHSNVRKLAEAMALSLIRSSIKLIEEDPTRNFEGDLAKRINKRLVKEGKTPLTRKEEIGASIYAQHLPNLNELTDSNRLKSLLEEDFALRKERQRKERNKANRQRRSTFEQKKKSGLKKTGK